MSQSNKAHIFLATLLSMSQLAFQSLSVWANEVTYTLPYEAALVYPAENWLPEPYQKYYQGMSSSDVIQLFTKDSLDRDGIKFDSISVDQVSDGSFNITIVTDDPNASFYPLVHRVFVGNYAAALNGVDKCKNTGDCWNKNNTRPDEPWAFFPQFGLPMVMQKSVLFLNYPPSTALTEKDYLNTFTMSRWTRVLTAVGIDDPILYETIIDIRPIAAPGSNTSQNLPDAQTYFNDPSGKTGGYYINPQLTRMLDPQSTSASKTLPLVVLGTPAREEWNKITGVGEGILTTGSATIPGASKPTPFILGNHPDVTTYQCCSASSSSECKDSHNLIPDEEIDVQIACWAQAMSQNPDADPETILASCRARWVTNRAKNPEDDQTFCALARIDSNECFGKDISWATAVKYCEAHDNNPCATSACPTSSSLD